MFNISDIPVADEENIFFKGRMKSYMFCNLCSERQKGQQKQANSKPRAQMFAF